MKTEEQIINYCAKTNAKNDYQFAQNDAFEMALNDGYSQADAEEIARRTGFKHADFAID